MNHVMKVYYLDCWWVGTIKSYHSHDKKYIYVFFFENVEQLDIDEFNVTIGRNLEMTLHLCRKCKQFAIYHHYFKLKVFNKVSFLKMLAFKT